MPYLLNLIYGSLLIFLSPWLLWRRMRYGKNRRGWAQKLLGNVPARESDDRPLVWFHAVSVGEVNLLQPLISRLSTMRPELRIAVSTTTETGFDLAQKKYATHTVFFCPMDFTWAINNVLRRLRPELLVTCELELWPNLVGCSNKAGVPVMVVNGRLSEKSFAGYQKWSGLVRSIMQKIDCAAVQNRVYAERFEKLGMSPERIHITGNIKFDGAIRQAPAGRLDELRRWAGIDKQTGHVFVAGSTQPSEEVAVIERWRELSHEFDNLRLVLVPRHPEKIDAACGYMRQNGIPFRRRSEKSSAPPTGSPAAAVTPAPVIVIDVIGELGDWWAIADAAFVGGSLGSTRGGQNMIEPAALGVPVCFGPDTSNFQSEVRGLLSAEAAVVVRSAAELQSFVRKTIAAPDLMRAMGSRAVDMVAGQAGAADATVGLLTRMLDGEHGESEAANRKPESESESGVQAA